MFSPSEAKVLKILGRRKMSIKDITAKFYEDLKNEPFNANNFVGLLVRRINSKCEYYDTDWRLKDDGKTGRAGKTVWKEKI